ncbi:Pectin lyase B [Madurella mycetomatis]|uniref:Pectin lyase B n=1 Tax=Madurella mycetomatis TaxID=100816 RepID=A0A175W3T0_9PEZI|nr:Pectin lyase B [Madurella mycetomatis]
MVTGAAEGFAKGITGGDSATPVYPKTTAELVSYLGDSQARRQDALREARVPAARRPINKNNWCDNYQPNAPKVSITYDKAGVPGITAGSNESLIGVGSKVNIQIINLNPHYVWGGSAITRGGSDMVWIDHVMTSLIGRKHIVFGNKAG